MIGIIDAEGIDNFAASPYCRSPPAVLPFKDDSESGISVEL